MLNIILKNGLKSRKNKRNLNKKKIIPKKVIIKVDNHHNEKMVNNFLNNLKNKNNENAEINKKKN